MTMLFHIFPLKATRREPEYKTAPPLNVSSSGTDNTKKNVGRLPYGCALLTSTSTGSSNSGLKKEGINWIIHATPMPEGDDPSLFFKMAGIAIQNSILLAERVGIKKLATCFLGGNIFCRNETSKQPLANAIVRAAVAQLEDCPGLEKLIFVDYDGKFFENARKRLKDYSSYWKIVKDRTEVVKGDICNKSIHEADAIVNSENIEMEWRGGISRAIKTKLGTKAAREVDEERHTLVNKFNDSIELQPIIKLNSNGSVLEENEKISCQTCFSSITFFDTGGCSKHEYYSFFIVDDKDNDEKIKNPKKFIFISTNHPLWNKKERITPQENFLDKYFFYEFSWKKLEEDKTTFYYNDFIELVAIEERLVEQEEQNEKNFVVNHEFVVYLEQTDQIVCYEENKLSFRCHFIIVNDSLSKKRILVYNSHPALCCFDIRARLFRRGKVNGEEEKYKVKFNVDSKRRILMDSEESCVIAEIDQEEPFEIEKVLNAKDDYMEQMFGEKAIKEWIKKAEGPFKKVENVKKLIESVKDDAKFLNLIKTGQDSDSLANFFANKSFQKVIMVVKRFEFDNLPENEKETERKKMRKYYQLKANENLTEEQINEYLYKKVTGKMNSDLTEARPNSLSLLEIVVTGIVICGVLGMIFLLYLFLKKNKKLLRNLYPLKKRRK